jgi:ubiquinone/menaquinone biosynthesis C-methylase UbiE
MLAIKIVLIIIGVLILFRIAKRIWHFPAPAFAGYFFGSNLRRWGQPPAQVIERSGIEPGMTVVDLGCGSGAFTPYVARVVGKEGRVYGVDIQPGMLKQLERRLAGEEFRDIHNVELKLAGAYELPFEDGSIDLVYMVGVLQEIPDRGRALREVRRVLRKGGILAVTEMLIDPDYPWRSTTVRICRHEGFTPDASLGNIWIYTARFRK